MHVDIGPVGVASAVAWIRYGRLVLSHLRSGGAVPLSENVIPRFSELLDQFEATAGEAQEAGVSFHWVGERSPEEVEFMMKGLFEIGLATEREHELGRLPLRPADADEFHVMVVRQILAEVEMEGPAHAQFVEGIRADWGVARQD